MKLLKQIEIPKPLTNFEFLHIISYIIEVYRFKSKLFFFFLYVYFPKYDSLRELLVRENIL